MKEDFVFGCCGGTGVDVFDERRGWRETSATFGWQWHRGFHISQWKSVVS
jgi:hypothetical protein